MRMVLPLTVGILELILASSSWLSLIIRTLMFGSSAGSET